MKWYCDLFKQTIIINYKFAVSIACRNHIVNRARNIFKVNTEVLRPIL